MKRYFLRDVTFGGNLKAPLTLVAQPVNLIHYLLSYSSLTVTLTSHHTLVAQQGPLQASPGFRLRPPPTTCILGWAALN